MLLKVPLSGSTKLKVLVLFNKNLAQTFLLTSVKLPTQVLKPYSKATTGVPAGSVVVAGSLPSKCGTYSLYAAIIVKKVDAKTRAKTSLNDLLRAD